MQGPSPTQLGVVCRAERFDEVERTATRAGIRLMWMDPSLDRVIAQSTPRDVVLVEWEARPQFRLSIATLLERKPRPALILVGVPTRSDVFDLSRAGLEGYAEIFAPDTFRNATALARFATEQKLRSAARANLGHMGVKAAQRLVRIEMFHHALAMENGNRHAAARVLQVDRRYVLKMARESARASTPMPPAPDTSQ